MDIKRILCCLFAIAGFSVLAVPGASAQGIHLHAVLVGGNETPNPGHPTAYGTAAVTFKGGPLSVCVTFVVAGLPAPTMAHIHRGFGVDAGPVVVTLNTPTAGNPGFSAGCYPITTTLYNEIRGNAVRGQLFQ
jgi:hypothetical protein